MQYHDFKSNWEAYLLPCKEWSNAFDIDSINRWVSMTYYDGVLKSKYKGPILHTTRRENTTIWNLSIRISYCIPHTEITQPCECPSTFIWNMILFYFADYWKVIKTVKVACGCLICHVSLKGSLCPWSAVDLSFKFRDDYFQCSFFSSMIYQLAACCPGMRVSSHLGLLHFNSQKNLATLESLLGVIAY